MYLGYIWPAPGINAQQKVKNPFFSITISLFYDFMFSAAFSRLSSTEETRV